MLTAEQRDIALRAISRSKDCERGEWRDGGPLAQIALLTGNTEAELKHWDEVGNGDGPLTIRRIQESDNGFAGWPLALLERLDREWRAGAQRSELERIVRAESEPHTDGGEPVAAPTSYEGPERRSAFTVAIDIKGLMLVIGLIGPLVAVITMVLQVRQDVRGNSVRVMQVESDVKSLQQRMAEQEKAKLLYCSGRREAAARDTNGGAIRIPDADC